MRDDDKETVSERAERALAKARAKTRPPSRKVTDSAVGGTAGGRWLALIPLTVCVVMFLLVMPRATKPEAIPMPRIDERVLADVQHKDDRRAVAATEQRLPSDVLSVGSELRAFNAAQAHDAPEPEMLGARASLTTAMRVVSARDATEELATLRAYQLRSFLDEVARFEDGKENPKELDELAGTFVRRMVSAGWIVGRQVQMNEAQRRAAFKTVWNATLGLDENPALRLTLDEQRVLYTLYLTHPHPPEHQRALYDTMRREARTLADCERAHGEEQRATELWRVEKIKRLGTIDPEYPTSFAVGVAYYRAGRYDLAADAFRSWVDAHPDGPLTIRARNHLKASLAAYDSI